MISTNFFGFKTYIFALTLLTVFTAACSASLTTLPPVPIEPPTAMVATPSLPAPALISTLQLAADYLTAVRAADLASLSSLIGSDAWCTTPGSVEMVKKQVENFGSASIRNVKIEELEITGWVAYPPGSEAARISLEYQEKGGLEWIPASMVVVTVQSPDKQARSICNVTN